MQNKTSKNRKPFSEDEDQKLKKLVKKYGEKSNWKIIASMMHGRDSRQCRDRWNHYLAPNNNSTEWSPEEDEMLMNLYFKNGRKWALFKIYFPGRTAVNIKSRWYRLNRHMSLYQNKKTQEDSQISGEKIQETNNKNGSIEQNFKNIEEILDKIFDAEIQNDFLFSLEPTLF